MAKGTASERSWYLGGCLGTSELKAGLLGREYSCVQIHDMIRRDQHGERSGKERSYAVRYSGHGHPLEIGVMVG